MRSVIIAAALVLSPLAGAADYELDPAHSYVYFAIDHAGLAKSFGRFNDVQGTLSMDREAGTGSLAVTIAAESIDTNHQKRDDHTRSPDFLNAVEFPDITYKADKVTFNGDTATVEGELTVLGTTKPVTLNVSRIVCGNHVIYNYEACGFDATATVKRSEFGMNYGLPQAVGDEMQLFISAEARKL